jgi:pre-rRNA-processing protein IPI1
MGLKDLFLHFPEELPMHAMAIIEKLSPRITDSDRSVRQTFLLLLRSSILPGLPQVMMGPLVPGLMAHVSSAMTHLVLDIRTSACSFLDLLVHHYPALVLPFSSQIVQHYMDLLGKGGVSALSMAQLGSVLSSLVNFLAALHSSLATQPVETKKVSCGCRTC